MIVKLVKVQEDVTELVELITGTIGGKLFYSENGEVLILTDRDNYIVSVAPGGDISPEPSVHSAYTSAHPIPDVLNFDPAEIEGEVMGWTTGWDA